MGFIEINGERVHTSRLQTHNGFYHNPVIETTTSSFVYYVKLPEGSWDLYVNGSSKNYLCYPKQLLKRIGNNFHRKNKVGKPNLQ